MGMNAFTNSPCPFSLLQLDAPACWSPQSEGLDALPFPSHPKQDVSQTPATLFPPVRRRPAAPRGAASNRRRLFVLVAAPCDFGIKRLTCRAAGWFEAGKV